MSWSSAACIGASGSNFQRSSCVSRERACGSGLAFDVCLREGGRPWIAAERLQCLFSIRSERAVVEHIDFNMMYGWFVGLTLDEAIWDHSRFSANHERLLKRSVMCEFFGGVITIAEWGELVSDEHFSVVSSLCGRGPRTRAWSRATARMSRLGRLRAAIPRSISEARTARTRRTSRAPTPIRAREQRRRYALRENWHGLIVDLHTRPQPPGPSNVRPRC